MYISKEIHHGYNSYIDTAKDDLGTQMDVGLLVMEAGDTYTIEESEKPCGTTTFYSRGFIVGISVP